MNFLFPFKGYILTAFFLVACCIYQHNAVFVDFCELKDLENIFQRTDLISAELSSLGPAIYGGNSGYFRNFWGLNQHQNYSFITWAFPQDKIPDRAFMMALVNSTSTQPTPPFTFSVSNDNMAFTTLSPSLKYETDSLSKISRYNYTLTIKSPSKYLRVEWASCKRDDCPDFLYPNIQHLCTWNSTIEEYSDSWCFNPAFSNLPPKYVPVYCGVTILDSFMNWRFLLNKINDRAGKYELFGNAFIGLDTPHLGLGENQLQLAFYEEAQPYFREYLHSMKIFMDVITAQFKYLYFTVTADAGSEFFINFGVNKSVDPSNVASFSKAVSSTKYRRFTSTALTQTFLIPISDFDLQQNTFVQFVNFHNFTVPKTGPGFYKFRPIAFLTGMKSPRFSITGRHISSQGGSAGSWKFVLPKTKGRSFLGVSVRCPKLSNVIGNNTAILKFTFIPTSRVSFDIEFHEGNCQPNALPRITQSQIIHFDYQRDEYIGQPQDVFANADLISIDRISEVIISNVQGDSFELIDPRFSAGLCIEASNPLQPNLFAKPSRANFTRHPLADVGITYNLPRLAAIKRSVVHEEL